MFDGLTAEQLISFASFLGYGILGIVAAFGIWYGKRNSTPAERTVEVAGALIDNKAMTLVAAAIEGLTMEIIRSRTEMIESRAEMEKARKLGYELIETFQELVKEMSEVRRALATLTTEFIRKK